MILYLSPFSIKSQRKTVNEIHSVNLVVVCCIFSMELTTVRIGTLHLQYGHLISYTIFLTCIYLGNINCHIAICRNQTLSDHTVYVLQSSFKLWCKIKPKKRCVRWTMSYTRRMWRLGSLKSVLPWSQVFQIRYKIDRDTLGISNTLELCWYYSRRPH